MRSQTAKPLAYFSIAHAQQKSLPVHRHAACAPGSFDYSPLQIVSLEQIYFDLVITRPMPPMELCCEVLARQVRIDSFCACR